MKNNKKDFSYDVIIIGAGAAGCSAAIYATRFKLKTALLGGPMPGGLITEASEVENYPGYLSINGQELAKKFLDQAIALGADYKVETVEKVAKDDSRDRGFKVITTDNEYFSKSLILAMGTRHKKLGIKGEEKFVGMGVSYCSTCDAPFFENKVVAVCGGGNSAVEGANDVSIYAKKVYLIYRSKLKATPVYIENMRKRGNITEVPMTNITEIIGDKVVTEVVLDKPYNNDKILRVDGVFIQIGYAPQNEIAKLLGVKVNGYGYVVVDSGMGTNIEGVFCAGDMNTSSNMLHQQITSAAEGSISAQSAYRYLSGSEYIVKV